MPESQPNKPKKYLVDGVREGNYIRAWKEGKGGNAEIVVQVWKGKDKPEGEPSGDWGMPAILGLEACIGQAVIQTE